MNRTALRLNVVLWLAAAAVACLSALPARVQSAAADQVPPGPTRLLRFADISKEKVVFAYAGDLVDCFARRRRGP